MPFINTYLTFNGNCEEAFNFYKSVFGGEFQFLGRFKEMPAEPGIEIPESEKEKIMHVSLPISKETVLMGCDSSEAFGQPTIMGNNFSLSVNVESNEEADQLFEALSSGGAVTMKMEKTFWGAYFGMLMDRFGIQWMINHECDPEK